MFLLLFLVICIKFFSFYAVPGSKNLATKEPNAASYSLMMRVAGIESNNNLSSITWCSSGGNDS